MKEQRVKEWCKTLKKIKDPEKHHRLFDRLLIMIIFRSRPELKKHLKPLIDDGRFWYS